MSFSKKRSNIKHNHKIFEFRRVLEDFKYELKISSIMTRKSKGETSLF